MSNRFSMRRLAMLFRKHYIENGRLYLLLLAGGVLLLAFSVLSTVVNHDMYFFELVVFFSSIFFPLLMAKMSFAPYYQTKQKIVAFTLPATQGEKYTFAVVNTIVSTLIICAIIEVAASLVAPYMESPDYSPVGVGSWFGIWWNTISTALIVGSMMIFACSSSKDSPMKNFMLVACLFIIAGFIPTLLLRADSMMWLQERPTFLMLTSADLVSVFTEGSSFVMYHNNVSLGRVVALAGDLWWPVVMITAGYFRFREHQMR